MSKIIDVDVWLSIVNQIHYETNGFSVNPEKLPDHKLIQLKPVDEWVIDFAPRMLKAIHPKDRGRFKNCIVYLTSLRQRQGEEWRRQNEAFKDEQDQLKRDIQELQNRLNEKANGRHNDTTTQNHL